MTRPFVVFYYSAAACAALIMNGYNIGIDGSSLEHIFKLDFYFVTGVCLLFTIALHAYTRHRLASLDGMPDEEAFVRLTRFPLEVFAAVAGFAAAGSALYHGIEVYWLRIRPFDELVVRHIVVEQVFGWTAAFLYLAAIRRLLRPRLNRLRAVTMRPSGIHSFAWVWLAAFGAGLALTAIPQLWFLRNGMINGAAPSPMEAAAVSLVALALSTAMMLGFFIPFRSELLSVAGSIRAFLRPESGARDVKLPVGDRDEIGALATAMNELEAKAAKAEAELREDLRLGGAVRRMLLPPERFETEGWRVSAAHGMGSGVGGTFCDVMRLPDGRVAFAAGETSGVGAPAALVMAAVLMLLRTELRDGGSADDVLRRLNGPIREMAGGSMTLSLALAIAEPEDGTVECAAAGAASVSLWREGAVQAALTGGGVLPLGAGGGSDAEYRAVRRDFMSADRLAVCSREFHAEALGLANELADERAAETGGRAEENGAGKADFALLVAVPVRIGAERMPDAAEEVRDA